MAAPGRHDDSRSATPGGPLWGAGPAPPVALVVLIVLVGTTVSIAYHYVLAAYAGLKYPWNTFLFAPKDHFKDYFNVYRHAQEFRPGVSGNMVYSPLLHLVMTVLNVVPAWVGFALMIAAFVATLAALLWMWTMCLIGNRVVRAVFVAVLGLLAYPVLYVLDRGNLEMLVFVTLAAFFYLYYWRRSPYAWVALSLAIAAKYYWGSLVVLLLLDRRGRQAVACVIGAAAVTVSSAVAIALLSGYSLADVFAKLSSTLAGHANGTTGSEDVVAYSHNLWAWVISIDGWTDWVLYWGPVQRIYLVAAGVIFVLVVRRLMVGDFADWQKATALVACTLVLPLESKDYTLVHLLLPLTLFAATWRSGRRAWASAALFGLLLIPLDYYYFNFLYWRSLVSTAVLVYPLLLVGLIVVALWEGDTRDSLPGGGRTPEEADMVERP